MVFFFQFNNYLDIYSLLVAPKSRNKGVANEIIEHTVAYCKSKKIKRIVLEVNETNIKAINFYKKKNSLLWEQEKITINLVIDCLTLF